MTDFPGSLASIQLDALHVFLLLNASGSMKGAAIERLNNAAAEILSGLQQLSDRHEDPVQVHLLGYRSTPRWLCETTAKTGLAPADVLYTDLSAANTADLAPALRELSAALELPEIRHCCFGHELILILTDGAEPITDEVRQLLERIRHPRPFPESQLRANPWQCRMLLNCGDGTLPRELVNFASQGAVPKYGFLGNIEDMPVKPLVFRPEEIESLLASIDSACFDIAIS